MKFMRQRALVFFIGVVSLTGLKITAQAETDDQILKAVQEERYKLNKTILADDLKLWETLSIQKLPWDQENAAIQKRGQEVKKQRQAFHAYQKKQLKRLSKKPAKKNPALKKPSKTK